MPARDPSYRAKALVFPCGYCGEAMPPGQAGLHKACIIEKTEKRVALRCKHCGSENREQNGDCRSHFHAVNRENTK